MEKGKGVSFVSSNLRNLKIITSQYSKESSSCVVACSYRDFYFIIEQLVHYEAKVILKISLTLLLNNHSCTFYS